MLDPIETQVLKAAFSYGERRIADALARNALRYVDEVRGLYPDTAHDHIARHAVERVLTEAKAHPPASALYVAIEERSDDRTQTGVWTEDHIAIVLRWSNRADFWVELKNVRGFVIVEDLQVQETFTLDAPSGFEVAPRGERALSLLAHRDRKQTAPRYSSAQVSGEAFIEAVVIGPWPEGSHRVRRFSAGSALFPVAKTLLME